MSKTETTITTKRLAPGEYRVTASAGTFDVSKTDDGEWSVSYADDGPWCETFATLREAKAGIAGWDPQAIERVPTERPAPKRKRSRTDAFNAKRAERIAAGGVNVANITDASVGLTGYSQDECALCDHGIKWLYVLHLTTSDKGVVTFEPVGSTCIRTWAEALPLSPAQERILAAVTDAEAEADKLRARFREINALERKGDVTEEQAAALIQFYAAPASIRRSDFLRDVASKVLRFGCFISDKQWTAWSGALVRDIANLNAPACGACGSTTRARSGKWGAFYGCTSYPRCKWTQNIKWVRPEGTSDSDVGKVESDPVEAAYYDENITQHDAHAAATGRDYDGDDLPF